MLARRSCFCLISIIFSIFINLSFLLTPADSKADPLTINGSIQTSTGGTQTLTASGGTGPYTWSVASGGGSIDPSTGISEAFSEAITNHDFSAEYVPTQILSERFKRAKYDGILYDSLVGRGRNIALFDIHAVDLNGDCTVHRVTKMNIKYLLGNVQQPEPL